ncbi:hypothetical protein AB0D38_40740, partial [Streptomyces sp. NPDC048279]|uniref:hypothetical protein n=1 Tax=Streptomyces sp. NPDC048279 TaxID=3154714 RepID=UPI003412E3F5
LRFSADVPYHLRAPYPEPELLECGTCGTRQSVLRPDPRGRRYPSGAQLLFCLTHLPASEPVQAAAGVITAAMKNGAATPQEFAQAEADAGILFDPARAEDIAAAAAEQAHAEDEAELAERGRQLARMAGAQRRVDAVGRLLEGRPGTDLLLAAEVGRALEYGTTPLAGFPMTLSWTGYAAVPDAHTTRKRTVVRCRSSHGQDADLVIDGDNRTRLAEMLDTEAIRDINAPCPHEAGCGSGDAHLDSAGVFGWFRMDVGGLESGPRWYCSPGCVNAAMLRAGDDLSLRDQAVADPAEQAPPAATVSEDVEDVARCVRCGCTEDAACPTGCSWVPNGSMVDLCSACATPEELAAVRWTVAGGGQS